MQKSLFFSVLLVMSNGLAGCAKSQAAPSTGASARPAASTSAPVASAASGPHGLPASCSLITKLELEATLHDTFQEPAESKHVAGICEFTRKGGKLPFIEVTLLPYTTRSQFESEAAKAANLLKAKQEPVAGLGEEAFVLSESMLLVYAHGKAFELTYLFSRSSQRSEQHWRSLRWLGSEASAL